MSHNVDSGQDFKGIAGSGLEPTGLTPMTTPRRSTDEELDTISLGGSSIRTTSLQGESSLDISLLEGELPVSLSSSTPSSARSAASMHSLGKEVFSGILMTRKFNPFGSNRVTRFLRQWYYKPSGLNKEETKRYYKVIRNVSELKRKEDIQIIQLSVKAMQLLRANKTADYNELMKDLHTKVHQRVFFEGGGNSDQEKIHFYKLLKGSFQIVDDFYAEFSATHNGLEKHTGKDYFLHGREIQGTKSLQGLNQPGKDVFKTLEGHLMQTHTISQELFDLCDSEMDVFSHLIRNNRVNAKVINSYQLEEAIKESVDKIHSKLTLSHKSTKQKVTEELVQHIWGLLDGLQKEDIQKLGIEKLQQTIDTLKHDVIRLETEHERNLEQIDLNNFGVEKLRECRNFLNEKLQLLLDRENFVRELNAAQEDANKDKNEMQQKVMQINAIQREIDGFDEDIIKLRDKTQKLEEEMIDLRNSKDSELEKAEKLLELTNALTDETLKRQSLTEERHEYIERKTYYIQENEDLQSNFNDLSDKIAGLEKDLEQVDKGLNFTDICIKDAYMELDITEKGYDFGQELKEKINELIEDTEIAYEEIAPNPLTIFDPPQYIENDLEASLRSVESCIRKLNEEIHTTEKRNAAVAALKDGKAQDAREKEANLMPRKLERRTEIEKGYDQYRRYFEKNYSIEEIDNVSSDDAEEAGDLFNNWK